MESYFDIDQILRYLAVHTAVVNLDSYSSNMQQNYYLYEEDGYVTILPWDYNLAFGGFQPGTATETVNFPIDTPVSGVEMSERPLIQKLLEVPEYQEKYHAYLQEIANYFSSVEFEEQVRSLNNQISDYVLQDATKFCSFSEYENAVEIFIQFCQLRAESIQGQLDGTIPSDTEGQLNSSNLVDASQIQLDAMGSQGGGREGGGQPMGMEPPGGDQGRDMLNTHRAPMPPDNLENSNGGGNVRGMPPDIQNGNLNESARSSEGISMPDSKFPPNDAGLQGNAEIAVESSMKDSGILVLAISFIVLVLGLIFAGVYRRRKPC